MTPPTELEIKYQCLAELSAADIEAVPLAPFHLGERTDHPLRDTLLDTPSRAFARRRMALRLRRDGARHFVTLKGPKRQEGLALRRDEFEVELPDGSAEGPATWPEPLGPKVVAWSAGESLQPLFTIHNQRVSWPIFLDRRRVAELVLDRGQIKAAGLSEPLHELEIELKEGKATQLNEIAGRLVAALPLRHATRGKAERGFALLQRALEQLPRPNEAATPEERNND